MNALRFLLSAMLKKDEYVKRDALAYAQTLPLGPLKQAVLLVAEFPVLAWLPLVLFAVIGLLLDGV